MAAGADLREMNIQKLMRMESRIQKIHFYRWCIGKVTVVYSFVIYLHVNKKNGASATLFLPISPIATRQQKNKKHADVSFFLISNFVIISYACNYLIAKT